MTLHGGATPGPNPNKSLAKARAAHVNIVESMYDLIGNTETRGGNRLFGETIGVHISTVSHVSKFLKDHGFLATRYVGMPPGSATPGKITLWVLHGTKEEAVEALKQSWEHGPRPSPATTPADADDKTTEEISEPEPPVALASNDREEVRAIAGPEPMSPFEVLRALRKDESGALIEAARQYANRAKLIETKIGELEAAGVHIDRSAIQVDKDEILEAVSLVLPFVNRMESSLTNVLEQNDALRKKMADYDLLKRNYEVLKKRFEKDVATKVANTYA